MFKLIVCSILLITIVTANAVPKIPNDVPKQLIVVSDVSERISLKEQGIKLININGIHESNETRYVLGSRLSNDQLVSWSSNNYTFNSSQDAVFRLQYPISGQGAIVTYTEIDVYQSSFMGGATLISGGVGHRSIEIVVEAYNTLYFNYVAKVYGI